MFKTPPSTSPPEATTVRQEDYASSPIHCAVATGDHTALTKLLSNLPKLSDPTRILTEAQSLAEERLAKEISAVLDNRDNPLKETPLHLAIRLNDLVATRAIAVAGANVSLRNAAGWDAVEEALLRNHREVAPVLIHHGDEVDWYKWRRRRPRLIASFRRMRDFYMEISFHFESILPLVGKFAPSDTYKIWKRGGNLRADFSMTGYDGLNIKRGRYSILFLNDEADANIRQGSLLFINHEKKVIRSSSDDMIRTPLSDAEVDRRCNKTLCYRSRIDVSRSKLMVCKNWRRQDRIDKVGEWSSRVYEMHNVILSFSSRKLDASSQNPQSEFSTSLRPTIWLTEQFPLKTEELHRLLDILSKKIKAVRRLKEVIMTTFPSGTFPVKVAIPVVPAVRVVISFTKFVELQPAIEEFFTPPSSPRNMENEQSEEESSNSNNLSSSSSRRKGRRRHKHKSSSGDGGGWQEMDPFLIPHGYTWKNCRDSPK